VEGWRDSAGHISLIRSHRRLSCSQLLLELPDGKTDLRKVTSHERRLQVSPFHARSYADCYCALLYVRVVQYRPDLTVGYVKVEVAKAHGIPFDCQVRSSTSSTCDMSLHAHARWLTLSSASVIRFAQELELYGKPMADPFSLSDYPALKVSRASNPVRVVVKRVVPSDGEGDEAELVADGGKGGEEATSDYDDESFED
jgi:hypothetical protein